MDTSFYPLSRLANVSEYCNYGHLTNDTDLNILPDDKRRDELNAIVKANRETQEKYLPMMTETVKNGNAQPGNLAQSEDRIVGKRREVEKD